MAFHGTKPTHDQMAEEFKARQKVQEIQELGLVGDHTNYANYNTRVQSGKDNEVNWPYDVNPQEEVISLHYATVII